MKTYKSVRGFRVGLRKILIDKGNRVQGNLWYNCLLNFCADTFTVLVIVIGKKGEKKNLMFVNPFFFFLPPPPPPPPNTVFFGGGGAFFLVVI